MVDKKRVVSRRKQLQMMPYILREIEANHHGTKIIVGYIEMSFV